MKVKQLIFYWGASYLLATLLYYILGLFVENVFNSWLFCGNYHREHPVAYIAIICYFYGIFATVFSKRFSESNSGENK